MVSSEDTPLYGKRLLPKVLDDQAQTDPDRICAAIAKSDISNEGFRNVAFSQVTQAVNFLAYTL